MVLNYTGMFEGRNLKKTSFRKVLQRKFELSSDPRTTKLKVIWWFYEGADRVRGRGRWGGGRGRRGGERRERGGRKGEGERPTPPPPPVHPLISHMRFSHEFVNCILLLPQDSTRCKKYKCIIKCTGNCTGKQPNISADQLSTHIVFFGKPFIQFHVLVYIFVDIS